MTRFTRSSTAKASGSGGDTPVALLEEPSTRRSQGQAPPPPLTTATTTTVPSPALSPLTPATLTPSRSPVYHVLPTPILAGEGNTPVVTATAIAVMASASSSSVSTTSKPSLGLSQSDYYRASALYGEDTSFSTGQRLTSTTGYAYNDLYSSRRYDNRRQVAAQLVGALQPGGAVNLLARENIGLLLNYMAVGIFNGAMPSLVYPLFKIYLNLEGYQSNATSALLNFAWYLKFPLGLLSDSVPICGYRRKPYIYMGWTLLVVIMALLTCAPTVKPYKSARDGEIVNVDAHTETPGIVVPLMLASIGYLMADVACDGIMVEYAQREGEARRGHTQTMVYGARFTAELFGTLLVALGLNSEEYGGDFSFALPLGMLFGILMGVGILALAATTWCLRDEHVDRGLYSIQVQMRGIWRIMRHRATWQITVYGFLQFFTFGFDVSPSNTINEVWLEMDPIYKSMFYCLNSGVYALATYMMRNYLLNTDWRSIMLVSVLAGIVIGLPCVLVTVFDIYRNQFFYLAKDQAVGFFDALAMMVRLVVIVEIAEPGLESSTYSLITTVFNLAIPIMTATSNLIGSAFDVYDSDMERDTPSVRWQVAIGFFVMYGLRLTINLAILPLLPRQKMHARQLKMYRRSNKYVGVALFSFFGAVFVASLASNFLAILESTACMRFAGGHGC